MIDIITLKRTITLSAVALATLLGNTYFAGDNTEVIQAAKVISNKGPLRSKIDWNLPSQTTPYPNIHDLDNFWIKVSLTKNRTYLMNNDKVIYAMFSSGGVFEKQKDGSEKSTTPLGTYYIEPERGESFFNNSLNEGANYWVSWKNHGEYLFHTVPTTADGKYNKSEAAKLGKKPASHGCIRLSVPDAKWLFENVPTNTKVVIVK